VSSGKVNLPLIIGCSVGGLAVIAIGGFLTYYIIRVKKRNA
jgi:hypothetical protein